jgi:acetolactate synthase-1/2/3 large subunit
MLGMHGTKASNNAALKCDLFIAIGTRFSDRVISDPKKFARNAKILHIDIDAAEIDKNIKAYHSVLCDAKQALIPILEGVREKSNKDWLEHITSLKQNYKIGHAHIGTLSPYYIMNKIYEMTDSDTIITTEVGQHQIWAAQYYPYTKPRTFISSGGFGTMGYGPVRAWALALHPPGAG